MKDNLIQKKSYEFSIKIIHFYKLLIYKEKEFVLSKQLLRSGTSIGANIEEALGGQSRRDFISKMSISYKEARESIYWLRLIKDTCVSTSKEAQDLLDHLKEIVRIISAILVTTKNS